MKIILWSEFPAKVDWKRAKALFRKHKLKVDAYVVSRSLKDYKKWKKRIESKELSVGAWPTLSKKEDYWFSGFCSKKSIDKLNEFSGQKFKIDLEPPFPTWIYSDPKFFLYILNLIFKKGKNSEYLRKTIDRLSKNSKILVNEIPFPKSFLKKSGVFYDTKVKKNVAKNIMLYSTIPSKLSRPFSKMYLRNYARRAVGEYGNNISFSIGLIGTGILQKERAYSSIYGLREDLEFMKSLKVKTAAIYSLDAIMAKGNSASEWIRLIKEYQK